MGFNSGFKGLKKWRQRHSRMEGKNVLLEEEIMSQGYEQRGRGS